MAMQALRTRRERCWTPLREFASWRQAGRGGVLIVLLGLSAGCVRPSAQERPASEAAQEIKFIGVLQDNDTASADERLAKFLEKMVGRSQEQAGAKALGASWQRHLKFPRRTMPYSEVIRQFAEWEQGQNEGAYLARITPYALVAAEMLGARFDILAIYRSAVTHDTTYHSYFVVNRKGFDRWRQDSSSPPTLESLKSYLKAFNRPARFIYHDRFSTSSYFLPSLYFREQHIFAMSQTTRGDLTPIHVEKSQSSSSSALVEEVAEGRADLAAVWDGTKEKFEKTALGGQVLFIEIPTRLPNDLLVCARWLNQSTKEAILAGIAAKPLADRADDAHDDFESWLDINAAEVPDATREALAKLRQSARERLAPVTVRIEGSVRQEYLDAARQAVRLSGTEYVLFDQDLHQRVDVTWTLESIHDGALKLTSQIEGSGLGPESVPISFVDVSDLPKRIADLARSRLRRIRYVWPYEDKYPAVLRDFDFIPDRDVTVQRVSWTDPETHEYEQDTPFLAQVGRFDFHKLQLRGEAGFPRNSDGSFNFEPMSNIVYRVIVAREPHASWIWLGLPYLFIGVFGLAGVGFLCDLRRRQPPPTGFEQMYRAMVDRVHGPWRGCEIGEGGVLWCDLPALDQFVKELRNHGRFIDLVRSGGCDFSIGPIPVRWSILLKIVEQVLGRRAKLPTELMDAAGVGRVAALNRVVQFLLSTRRLSSFVGLPEEPIAGRRAEQPMEWEALNAVASDYFARLGLAHKALDVNLRGDSPVIASVVSEHFHRVLKCAMHDISFFRQSWTAHRDDMVLRLTYRAGLTGALTAGTRASTNVRIEMELPKESPIGNGLGDHTVNAWVLGKILGWPAEGEDGTLVVRLAPLAIVRDCAEQ